MVPFNSVVPKLITLQFTVYGETFFVWFEVWNLPNMLITNVGLDEVHFMLHTNLLYSGEVWKQYI